MQCLSPALNSLGEKQLIKKKPSVLDNAGFFVHLRRTEIEDFQPVRGTIYMGELLSQRELMHWSQCAGLHQLSTRVYVITTWHHVKHGSSGSEQPGYA